MNSDALIPIAIYGGAGRIGSIICNALDACSIERDDDHIEAETVIWCAATGDSDTHACLNDQAFLTTSFLSMLTAQKRARRIIFTSSFGAVSPINFYAAHKLACEAMLEPWAKMTGHAGISIRMGGFGPETPAGEWFAMTPEQIIAVYRQALSIDHGFHMLFPVQKL